MSAQQNHTVWTAFLSDASVTVAVGKVLCLNAAGTRYVIATTENLALQSLGSVGIAITSGDEDNPSVELQFCGMVPFGITGLGAGAAGLVKVSATGTLERGTTGEVVGVCDTTGNALVFFAAQGLIDLVDLVEGETNTASNVGSGADIFKQKAGVDFEFRGVLGLGTLGAAVNGDNIELAFTPGGTTTQAYYNNAGVLSTTDQITIAAGRATHVSPIVNGTPVYRSGGTDITSPVGRRTTASTSPVVLASRTPAIQDTEVVSIIVRSRRNTSNTKRGSWRRSRATAAMRSSTTS